MILKWLTVLCLILFATFSTLAQQNSTAITKDPQGGAILTQCLNSAGSASAIAAIQDYTATGTITYYWAGEEVQGKVTLKGRGLGQFRQDAKLPSGVRSWAVSNGTGFLRDVSGANTPLPPHNTLNLGSMTWPFVYLAAALQDANTNVSYVGLEMLDSGQVHHIRVWKSYSIGSGMEEFRAKLTTRDFFIDPATFQVVSTVDMQHPENQATVDYPHEVQFSDYRRVSGVLAPFSITERNSHQRTSTVLIEQITFNNGLQDSDFQ